MSEARPLVAISSEIGRGHPSYLDSVLTALQQLGRQVPLTTACGLGWSLARLLYRLGSQGGLATSLYNLVRTSRPSRLQLSLLDSGLCRRFRGTDATVIVDHPLLAHLLSPVCPVAYIHAEIAAPAICSVKKAWRILVPLEYTASRLVAAGISRENLCICGLFIEPEIAAVAPAAFAERQQRLSSSAATLTIGFFTSGAYPAPHLRAIDTAVASVLAAGHQVLVFAGCGQSRLKSCEARTFSSRQEENCATAASFTQLDCLVAAAHERTNWAVGLGLPMFALLPHIGPFAHENFGFAEAQGVCLPLSEPENFGREIRKLHHQGRLAEMSAAGWEKFPITGAETAASYLNRPS